MKNSTKAFLATCAVALFSCFGFSPRAHAVPITGGIFFAGLFTTNTGNVNTATAFTSFSGVGVTGGSGSYAGTSGTSVMMNGFSFIPFVPPVPTLWSFVFGGRTYTFNLTSVTSVVRPGDGTLTLAGNGIAQISGTGPTFDPTPYTFALTANQATGTFFTFGPGQTVPDGGFALALLGIGLTTIETLRRKLAGT